MTRHFTKGFTLIELLVVITIGIMIMGGGIAAYITFNDRQNLQNGAKLLQTYLRSAQTKARAGEKPAACDRLTGYRVVLTNPAGTGSVALSAVCANGVYAHSTYALPAGVSVSGVPKTITFANLYGGVTGAGPVVLNANGHTVTFSVTDGGEISTGVYQ